MSFNIKSLEDSAKDVDPDLRYMALEDFQKSLNNPKIQVKGVASFIPLLFKLLHDPISDVQNQAVKAFAPLVRHIDDSETVRVVNDLYSEADKALDQSKFTVSVPNMALRSIFQNSHARFGKQLSRVTTDTLLPQIMHQGTMSLSRIEILIDLIKYLGSILTLEEIHTLNGTLMSCAFNEHGIVSKRSIVAIDVLLAHVKSACSDQLILQRQFFNTALLDMISLFKQQDESIFANKTVFTLSLTVLTHVGMSKLCLLNGQTVDLVLSLISEKLDLSGLALDESVEDLDIDLLADKNYLRSEALSTLRVLIPCISYQGFADSYVPTLIFILKLFVKYDPLGEQDQNDYSKDEDEDIDFSDDEDIEQDTLDGSDGLASKLRSLALVALGKLLSSGSSGIQPILESELGTQMVNAIGDKSAEVSNEAIADTVMTLRLISNLKQKSDTRTSAINFSDTFFSHTYVPLIERQIFDNLLTVSEFARFSNLEVLIETLISTMAHHLSANFIHTLMTRLVELKVSLNSHPELIGLYDVIIDTYSLDRISNLKFILSDIVEYLEGERAYSSSISKFLHVCQVFYCKKPLSEVQSITAYEMFFRTVAERVNSRQYSSDVRQQLLGNLSELLIHIPITEEYQNLAVKTFSESLSYEVTVAYTIECLNRICERNPHLFDSMNLSVLIIEKLSTYLGAGDSALYGSSLTLIQTIFERTTYNGDIEVIRVLNQKLLTLLAATSDPHLINKALFSLGYILELLQADQVSAEAVLDIVIHFISVDDDEINSHSLEFLATKLSMNNVMSGSCLFNLALNKLDLSKFMSAKFIAIIVRECELFSEISKIEDRVLLSLETKDIESQFIFGVHFLGCISSDKKATKLTFNDFLSIINNDFSESVSLAAARALGLSVFSDFDRQLPVLLECFRSFSINNDQKKSLLLVSIKLILKQHDIETKESAFSLIWNTIVNAVSEFSNDFTHEDVPILKLAGEILSMVATLDKTKDYQPKIHQNLNSPAVLGGNNSLVYVMIVVTKMLLSDYKGDFDEKIIEQVISHLPKQNLDLKLAIISTILTGVYNKSTTIASIADDVILPLIFNELTAKEEFKKVIPMGPYKYVVDEGLEVRKLSYELINAMISVSDTLTQDLYLHVNKVRIIEILLAKGLNDSENDIINLAAENLVQIIQNDYFFLTQISNLQELIHSLSKLLSRNLRSKATTQEAESHGDTLRAIIKLSKVINNALVSDSALTSEWSNYYNDLKTRHQLLFHATV